MSEEPVKVDLIYGFVCVRPEASALIVEPPPLKWYQVIYYGALELWWNVILPAFLFALSFTAFKFAALGHF